jgi:hypothetical protein
MTIEEKIAADRAALDAAQAQLAADQAELEAATPHLSVLAEIEAFGEHLADDVRAAFNDAIARAKALF